MSTDLKSDILIVGWNILNFNLIHNVFRTQSEVFFHLIFFHTFFYSFIAMISSSFIHLLYALFVTKANTSSLDVYTKICKFYCHSLIDAFPDFNHIHFAQMHTISIYSKLSCSVFRNLHCLKSKLMPIFVKLEAKFLFPCNNQNITLFMNWLVVKCQSLSWTNIAKTNTF